MTKKQTRKLWQRIVKEFKRVPNWEKIKKNQKDYEKAVLLRDLLFNCRVILERIESGNNVKFNTLIFNKSMYFYCKETKKYV